MVTDFYLQFQGFFADISNMLPDIFLSARFCFICMVFCIPIKPRPPHSRLQYTEYNVIIVRVKQNSAAAVFSEKPLRRESSQSHSQSQRRGSESEGFKSAVSRHFRRDFYPNRPQNKMLRPQCSIRFRLRNRSKASALQKAPALYKKESTDYENMRHRGHQLGR